MTIENSTNKMLPQQMGITVNYPFTFNVILQDPTEEEAKKAIKATVLQKDGTEIELIYNADYTITLNTNRIGGTLTVKNMRTTDDKIVIYRQYKQTQEADYKDFNASPAETLEQCFDKLTMLSQQQQEEINRSLKLNVSSTKTNLSLPEPVASNTLIWDKQGENLINYDIIGENNKFKAEVNAGLVAGLADIQNQFDNLEAEQNGKFETFETEINENIETFKNDINTSIEEVLEASEKVNQLEESVATATNASKVATEQATIAKQQASIATNKANEAINASTETKNQINTRANLDLSNLSSTGQAKLNAKADVTSVLNKTQITNCLLEVPQNIKLELNNGVLTLKKGSKVIVPNGSNRFDEVVINSDINFTYTYAPSMDTPCILFINASGTGFVYTRTVETCFSGTTQPSGNYRNWYNTTENKMYSIGANATIDGSGFSFPIAIITQGSNGVTKSIDQVFNGFGFIGQHTFTLAGVKSLLPNGRNADGTFKNKEAITTSINVTNEAGKSSKICFFDGKQILTYGVTNYFEQDEKPTGFTGSATWLNTQDNVMYSTSNGGTTWTKTGSLRCYLGKLVKASNDNITEIEPNKPVELLKKGDIEKNLVEVNITNMIMPDYTAGVSVSSGYVAQQNGWIAWQTGTTKRETTTVLVDGITVEGAYMDDSHQIYGLTPIAKGSTFTTSGGTLAYATFYPCKGVK